MYFFTSPFFHHIIPAELVVRDAGITLGIWCKKNQLPSTTLISSSDKPYNS
jgi:hypothetical protein